MTRPRRTATLPLTLIGLLLLTGCTTLEPLPLETPDPAAANQIAIAMLTDGGEIPTPGSIMGPAVIVAGSPITVSGECRGGDLVYELRSATAGEDQRLLMGTTIDCDSGPTTSTFDVGDYTGPVQLEIMSTDGVDEGWVQATQEPVG